MTTIWHILFLGFLATLHAESNMNDIAPSFALSDQNGKVHRLEDYRGHWIVLYFYPKDATPGCTKEACAFRDHFDKIKAKAMVFGISTDSVESHARFAQKHQLPFLLLADPDGKVTRSYGVLRDLKLIKMAKRKTFLIDPEGKIRKRYDNVDPQSHPLEILGDLEQFAR
jgi:peroxiredoxin Q/BCP